MYNRYEYMRRRGNCPKKVLKETPTVETSDTEVAESVPAPRKRGRKKSVNTENTSEVSPNSETAEGVDSNV